MSTLAELKRKLTLGAVVVMTRNDWFPNGKLIGISRKVIKVQTNAIQFEGGSWLRFTKATDFVDINSTGFSVKLNPEKETELMSYAFSSISN